ncbi:hypothetical protein [Trichothermofontia sp.]
MSLGIVACAAAPPPTTSPPPSVLAPVNKAKDTANEVQQKALELERLGSETVTPSAAPTPP